MHREPCNRKLTLWLAAVNDNFILYLLGIIESASDDADDPYHYPVIRVLVCTFIASNGTLTDHTIAGLERTIPGSLHQSS